MCCSSTKNDKGEQNTKDELLTTFISKFDTLRLPLSIQRNDLHKYGNVDFDKVNRNDPKNPYYQTIDAKYYRYLENGTLDTLSSFYFLHAAHYNGFYIILYEQANESKESYWTKMNVLDNNGNIVDTLVLAGSKANTSEQYGQIDNKWKVKTVLYSYLPDEPSIYALVADVVNEELGLTPDGHFKRTSSSKQKGYFNIVDDTLVPYKNNK
jgi:hypothetical protein